MLPEPPNGTPVAIQKRGDYLVWIRDDTMASSHLGHGTARRWFTMEYSYCQTWEQVIKDADVYYLEPAMINGKVAP